LQGHPRTTAPTAITARTVSSTRLASELEWGLTWSRLTTTRAGFSSGGSKARLFGTVTLGPYESASDAPRMPGVALPPTDLVSLARFPEARASFARKSPELRPAETKDGLEAS
jgi:hypothetical protein